VWWQEDYGACYRTLFEIESYLRWLARWELRGNGGAEWLGLLPEELLAEVRVRIRQEQEARVVDDLKSGLLSYLHLSELKDLLCTTLWDRCLAKQWPDREVVIAEFKQLIAVRNKVAHFRPVTAWDVGVVRRFSEYLERWSKRYRTVREMSAVWKPEEDSGGLRSEVQRRIGWSVEEIGRDLLLAMEGGGAVSDGWVGCVGHHLTVGIRFRDGALPASGFLVWLDGHERLVSFLRVGDSGDALEVLIPAKAGAARSSDALRALFAVCAAGRGSVGGDAREEYEMDRREGLLPWSRLVPDCFVTRA
jgi:hypothetical protein